MRTFPRGLAVALLGALTFLPLAACEEKLTQENFDKIQIGMNIWEVEKILGGKGELESTGSTGGISAAGIMSMEAAPPNQYRWQHGNKMITVTAKDGKVVGKNKDRL